MEDVVLLPEHVRCTCGRRLRVQIDYICVRCEKKRADCECDDLTKDE